MYNDLILIVHKLVAPLQHQTAGQHHLSHGIINAIRAPLGARAYP